MTVPKFAHFGQIFVRHTYEQHCTHVNSVLQGILTPVSLIFMRCSYYDVIIYWEQSLKLSLVITLFCAWIVPKFAHPLICLGVY